MHSCTVAQLSLKVGFTRKNTGSDTVRSSVHSRLCAVHSCTVARSGRARRRQRVLPPPPPPSGRANLSKYARKFSDLQTGDLTQQLY